VYVDSAFKQYSGGASQLVVRGAAGGHPYLAIAGLAIMGATALWDALFGKSLKEAQDEMYNKTINEFEKHKVAISSEIDDYILKINKNIRAYTQDKILKLDEAYSIFINQLAARDKKELIEVESQVSNFSGLEKEILNRVNILGITVSELKRMLIEPSKKTL